MGLLISESTSVGVGWVCKCRCSDREFFLFVCTCGLFNCGLNMFYNKTFALSNKSTACRPGCEDYGRTKSYSCTRFPILLFFCLEKSRGSIPSMELALLLQRGCGKSMTAVGVW